MEQLTWITSQVIFNWIASYKAPEQRSYNQAFTEKPHQDCGDAEGKAPLPQAVAKNPENISTAEVPLQEFKSQSHARLPSPEHQSQEETPT